MRSRLLWYYGVILTLLQMLAGFSFAQTEAVVRIHVDTGGGVFSSGSGVVIDVQPSKSRPGEEDGLVLTCWHLFRDGQYSIMVEFAGGRREPAQLLGVDRQADLAALEVMRPGVEPVVLGSEITEKLYVCGYGPNAQLRAAAGRMTGQANDGEVTFAVIDANARDGDSGGPLINQRNEVVGVVWGNRPEGAYATYGVKLCQFVGRWTQNGCSPCANGICRQPRQPQQRMIVGPQTPRPQYRPQPKSAPKQIRPQPQPNNEVNNDEHSIVSGGCNCECDGKCTERLNALREEFEARIAALEKTPQPSLDTSQLPPITIEYLDGSGSVHDRETVSLGGTLQIDPIHVRRFVNGELAGEEKVPVGGDLTLWERQR